MTTPDPLEPGTAEPPLPPQRPRALVVPQTTQKLIAEFIGTFTLIFVGAGAILTAVGGGGGGLIEVAVAHGLAIGIMVTAFGHVSGGHFNPAVTFGVLVARRIEPVTAAAYWIAQLAGGTVAALFLRVLFQENVRNAAALGTPALGLHTGAARGAVIEAILTFFLVLVVFAVAIDRRGAFGIVAGLPIGGVITMDVCMGGPLTGAAMNPARWFGPALVQGHWDHSWVWIFGPLLGGGIAALLYELAILRGSQGDPELAPVV